MAPTQKQILDEFHCRLNASQPTQLRISRDMARQFAENQGILPPNKRPKLIAANEGTVIVGIPTTLPTPTQSRRARKYSIEDFRNGLPQHRD
jgi:hypothetical protein